MKSIVLKKRWSKSNTKFTKRQKEQFEKLLDDPFSCSKLDKRNNNLIHLAVICDEPKYVEKALHIEGLLEEKNAWGFTPYELARMLGREECIEVISPRKKVSIVLKKGAKTHKLNEKEYTKYTKVKYIPDLRFDNITIIESVLRRCKRALKNKDITREHKWRGAYYGKDIENNHIAPFRIEWISRMMGYGLFSSRPIKKGTFVTEYVGHLRKYHTKLDQKNSYCFEYLIADKFDTPFVIDAKDEGNFARYVNHDEDGNLSPIAVYHQGIMRVILKADRDIKAGEQLCYNYGPDYWASREDPADL